MFQVFVSDILQINQGNFFFFLVFGGGKYIRHKHHPQPLLAKRLGIAFVTDSRNNKSSITIACALA